MTARPKPRQRRPAFMMKVSKGALIPADVHTNAMLRDRKYTTGDIVSITISKCRNPDFNRLVHRIGGLCAANIDAFSGMDSHKVLKRLQIEADIGCEHIMIMIPGLGAVEQRIPLSLSFDSMEEGEFRLIARAFCQHIAQQYWPGMSAEQVEDMAGSFVDD